MAEKAGSFDLFGDGAKGPHWLGTFLWDRPSQLTWFKGSKNEIPPKNQRVVKTKKQFKAWLQHTLPPKNRQCSFGIYTAKLKLLMVCQRLPTAHLL